MSRRMTLFMNGGLFLFLIVLLLGACGSPTPGVTPTPGEPTATIPPTETPLPTSTPMPLPAPGLLFRSPAPGEEQPLQEPIELTFDQPMDRASVEAALTISPTLGGRLTWLDDRTVSFVPDRELERGARFRVTVDDRAENVEGKPLEEAVSFEFSTVGFLEVSQVMPAPGSEDLDPDTVVTVVFNRPVVPLTAINRQDELPQPLTFVPPVRGSGEWLNTSIYLFRPEEGLLPATQYKARVAAGLTDTSGAVLEEDYTWEFATVLPAILAVAPPEGFAQVGPTDAISVTFNQPMDHASVQAHFTLETDLEAVQGAFQWKGGEKAVDPETMLFVPDEPLPRDTAFVARVSTGVQARAGNAGTQAEKRWSFSTVKQPGIVKASPPDGARGVAPGQRLSITFASPMQTKGFLDYLTILPAATEVYTSWSENDTHVEIDFQGKPAMTYQFTLRAATPDRYGAPLGSAARIRFTTGDLSPIASLTTIDRLGTVSAYTDTVVYATYRNVSSLRIRLYRLSLRTFMDLNTRWEAWDEFVPNEDELVRAWSRRVQAPRNEARLARLLLVDGEGDPLPPGLYYVQLTAPEIQSLSTTSSKLSRYMFVKSRLNLTLKQTRSEALVWATDLASGQPVADLPVDFYSATDQITGSGRSDPDGLALVPDLPMEDLWSPFFAVAGEPGAEGFGIAFNGWEQGINPWDFGVDSEFWASDYQGYLYTDRPIYRPGQTVYFKGIVRADDDAQYRLPEEIDALQVHVNDAQGKELYRKVLNLSDMGTFYDQLVLDGEATLGDYFLEVQDPEHELYAGTSFRVAEYKSPEFQVSVTTARDAYLNGESINTTAEATYYFGGPVAGADVHWSVLSNDYYFQYDCPQGQDCPWYSWSDFEWGEYPEGEFYGGYGRLVGEGDGETDAEGRVTFRVPANLANDAQSQVLTLEASVTDINDQQVSSRTATIVHKGEFYIGVAPRGYLARVGEEKEVDLLTVDWDSQPVAGVDLTAVVMEHRWYSIRRQAEDGRYYWDWTTEDIPVMTTTVTTDSEGQAVVAFTPEKAGSYRVRATGHDSRENEIRSSAYFWVWGGDGYVSWRQESNNRIELIADKEEYQVGDVAEILVPSPYTGTVQALITVERGRIIETEVRELANNSEVLRLPIVEEHVPNVFVSILIVQGSEQAADGLATFKMGVVKLPVSLESKTLNIALTPDKEMEAGEHYAPRQTATYDVLVTDNEGSPVEAELSLRLADLAVLALADEPGQTLLETFWRNRGLGVKTSTPLIVAMEPFNREIAPRTKGGGGDEGEGLLRSRFADTAFWDAAVRTDEDGQAQVTVQLPDNLTTWRMQARGITADTRVGRAEVDVLSTLDLLVRPVLPRFFVVDDEVEIATVVHNNTGEALEAQVNISLEGLALEGPSSQAVNIGPGGQVRVAWPVTALGGSQAQADGSQQVNVRMWASAGDLYDGREDSLPLYHYSSPEVVATAGMLSEPGLRQEVIQLPRTFDPNQGELSVQLDGSLTAATQDALDYLEHYPYECVEQTVSRFLPNVATWQALDEMGLERPELRQKLAQMVGVALQRIYAQQHYDGGWGWWVNDESNPYLAAYVLQGMLEAHRAGFVVDQGSMDKAAGYLREKLPSVGRVDLNWEANRLAYELYVLAEYTSTFDEQSRGELGLAIRLFEKRHLLDHYGQATLAMALSLLEPDEPQRAQTLLEDLSGAAVLSATGTHWEEAEPDYWNMNTDVRTTAIVLWALSHLQPEDQLLPGTVRWLMAIREEGHWASTQDNAWSLLGLVAYMRASGELQGDFTYSLSLNGQQMAMGEVSAENIDESQQLQIEIGRLLVEEGNRLVIERQAPAAGQTGEGQLYYSAYLRYYLPAEQIQALDRGIVVARQYSPAETEAGGVARYVDTAQVGDVIQVKLTLIAPTDLYYVVVEDPLPAGFEGVDLSLKTTSVVGEQPTLRNLTAEEEDRWYRWYGWGWWWFSHSEMRDEKVVLFAEYLPRGSYEYTYLMRAGVPGEFHVTPTTAYAMYAPEVFGRSDGGMFTVEPAD
ncbi:MAG: Ig-like domain-containing protein [Anaerolineae bacterium]|nr:Ig-like domain-containing protein [Anaerolineae bacterium]